MFTHVVTEPVSYTHLDVYKRQVMVSLLLMPFCAVNCISGQSVFPFFASYFEFNTSVGFASGLAKEVTGRDSHGGDLFYS